MNHVPAAIALALAGSCLVYATVDLGRAPAPPDDAYCRQYKCREITRIFLLDGYVEYDEATGKRSYSVDWYCIDQTACDDPVIVFEGEGESWDCRCAHGGHDCDTEIEACSADAFPPGDPTWMRFNFTTQVEYRTSKRVAAAECETSLDLEDGQASGSENWWGEVVTCDAQEDAACDYIKQVAQEVVQECDFSVPGAVWPTCDCEVR